MKKNFLLLLMLVGLGVASCANNEPNELTQEIDLTDYYGMKYEFDQNGFCSNVLTSSFKQEYFASKIAGKVWSKDRINIHEILADGSVSSQTFGEHTMGIAMTYHLIKFDVQNCKMTTCAYFPTPIEGLQTYETEYSTNEQYHAVVLNESAFGGENDLRSYPFIQILKYENSKNGESFTAIYRAASRLKPVAEGEPLDKSLIEDIFCIATFHRVSDKEWNEAIEKAIN